MKPSLAPGARWGLVVAALLLAVASWVTLRTEIAQRRALDAEMLETTGAAPDAALHDRLRSETEPERARLLLARTLVNRAFRAEADGTQLSTRDTLARLDLAHRLSARALARRPAAWQAAMLLGSSTYLSRSLARDPSLFTDVPGWEDPLELARDLAPGQEEPARFLVSAYLELWGVLSPAKQKQTLALLADAFRDPATFRRLAPAWLQVAQDREAVFAPVPDDPAAWDELERLYSEARDWDGVRDAREHRDAALRSALGRDLEAAGIQLEGGEAGSARSLYHGVLQRARRDRAFAPLVEESLHRSPPGPAGAEAAQRYAHWLEFALDLCLVGDCPLPPPYLDRLTTLARPLPLSLEARGRLAAGRLVDAERLERRERFVRTPEWTRYHLERALVLLDRGDAAGAREALERVSLDDRDGAPYRWVATRVDGTPPPAEPIPAPGEAPLAWRSDHTEDGRPALRLFFYLPEPTAALAVEHVDVESEGTVVETTVDGRIQPPRRLRPSRDLVLETPLDAGLHLLQWRSVAGVPPRPARVRPLGPAVAPRPEPPRTPPPA